jgi:hypothetical protein
LKFKNGEIDGVLKSLGIEWLNTDETTTDLSYVWDDLDAPIILAIKSFLKRKMDQS